MIDPRRFLDELQGSGVDYFCGVPDSLLKSFCAYLTDAANLAMENIENVEKSPCSTCSPRQKISHVIAANEGGAIALASGHYLATGRPALVYMQNSGQGNAVNPLASQTLPSSALPSGPTLTMPHLSPR